MEIHKLVSWSLLTDATHKYLIGGLVSLTDANTLIPPPPAPLNKRQGVYNEALVYTISFSSS